jgi:hypothetical protein
MYISNNKAREIADLMMQYIIEIPQSDSIVCITNYFRLYKDSIKMSDYQLPKTACIITTILPFRVCIICEIIRKEVFHSLTLMDMESCLFVREDYKNTSKRQNPKSTFQRSAFS